MFRPLFRPVLIPVKYFSSVDLKYDVYENNEAVVTEGEPLIISHGLLGSKLNWRGLSKNLIKYLNPARKIIVVDNRNHGLSPKTNEHNYQLMSEDIIKLMDKLTISNAHLMGHSMGGRAVMFTALTNADRITSITVVDISPLQQNGAINNLKEYFEGLKTIDLTKLEPPITKARKQADDQLASFILDSATRQFVLQNLIQNEKFEWKFNLETLSRSFENIRNFPDLNTTYDKPTLFVGGGKSDFLPKDHIEGIRKIFSHAEFEYIENVGHLVHMENPPLFIKHTSEFLNKLN